MIDIALFYIGQSRYADIGRSNHEKLLEKLRKNFNVVVYNFTQPILDRAKCPFPENDTGAARIQIWDFYESLKIISERYVIKIRTDVWLTDSGIEVLIEELNDIIAGKQRISYLGMETKNYYKEIKLKLPVGKGKIVEYIVIADKNYIKNDENSMYELQNGKLSRLRSGNSTWKVIRNSHDIAFTTFCQISKKIV